MAPELLQGISARVRFFDGIEGYLLSPFVSWRHGRTAYLGPKGVFVLLLKTGGFAASGMWWKKRWLYGKNGSASERNFL